MSFIQASNPQEGKIYKGDPNHLAALEKLRINWLIYDVTLRIGCKDIQVHKVVLTAYFPYFQVMFTQQFTEKNQKVIVLQGVDGDATASLINFAYTGHLLVHVNNVQSLYVAADFFDMENAKLFCKNFLLEHLDVENALGVGQLGELFNSTDLIEKADIFITKRFNEVTLAANEEFLALEKTSLVRLFSRSDLSINSEIDVFNAVKIWIEHDMSTRRNYVYELLKTVRLVHLKSDDIEVVAEFCSSSVDCMKRINEAKVYHKEPCKRNEIDVGETIRRANKIYILFEESCNILSFKKESFLGETFEHEGNVKIERMGYAITVLNGNIHITGGIAHSKHGSSEVYSPSNDKSMLTSPMNCKRWYHGCCAHKGKIYVCGGKNGRPSTCCERLESKEGEWRFVASMNVGRNFFVVVSCGNHIWAFGGRNVEGEVFNSSEFYDEKRNKWMITTPMIERRFAHSAVAHLNKIYLVGGNNETSTLNSAEVFDIVTQQFSLLKSMKIPRGLFAMSISGEKIYCFGGNSCGFVESFNLITEEWTTEKSLPRIYFCYAAVTLYGN